MNSSDEILQELHKYTPTNWAIQDRRGRTCVVIEATSESIARRRVSVLRHELPRLPHEFTVTPHAGPTRCAWYSDGFFAVREEIDRASTGVGATQFVQSQDG